MTQPPMTPQALGPAYGLLAAPLAFGALPLYVAWPHHHAQAGTLSLQTLGVMLLAARTLDAVVDPMVGRWSDRALRRSEAGTWWWALGAAGVLSLSFAALWHAPDGLPQVVWLQVALTVCTLSCSALTVGHQAWGTRWSGSPVWRARIAAWREGAALAGVLLSQIGPGWAALALLIGLLAGLLALRRTFGQASLPSATAPAPGSPWQRPAFRWLVSVHLLNGLAAAIPATLLPFFVADRLQQPAAQSGFLLAYFGTAALAMPLWVQRVTRLGLAPTWRLGMLASLLAFAATPLLQVGDAAAFLLICLASGAALGADLAVPGALLAGVAGPAGAGSHAGWWAFVSKLSLALAAGLSLPALQALGYHSGSRDPAAVQALVWCYAGLPCLFKAAAMATLWRAEQRHPDWRATA